MRKFAARPHRAVCVILFSMTVMLSSSQLCRGAVAADKSATLIGWWSFDSATSQGRVPPRVGSASAVGAFVPEYAQLRQLVPGSNATALRLFGNASIGGFVVQRDRSMDGLKEQSIAMWVNYL